MCILSFLWFATPTHLFVAHFEGDHVIIEIVLKVVANTFSQIPILSLFGGGKKPCSRI
jgi:hypothetical protein